MNRRFVFFCLVLTACSYRYKDNIESEIVQSIKTEMLKYNSDTCTVDFGQIFRFDWDEFYFFGYNVPVSVVNSKLGVEVPDQQEFSRKYCFLKKGKLVRFQQIDQNIEGRDNNEVVFDIQGNKPYFSCGKKHAIFFAKTEELLDGHAYVLKKVRK